MQILSWLVLALNVWAAAANIFAQDWIYVTIELLTAALAIHCIITDNR